MSKHTPGPWYVRYLAEDLGKEDVPFAIYTQPWPSDEACICSGGSDFSLEEDIANFKLIAAAPELLDKLEVALRRLKEKSDDSNRDFGLILSIENTIAKTRGEA